MNDSNILITDYKFELLEDHHHPGSGNYGVRVILPRDISDSFPYLNAVLDDAIFEKENKILIGVNNQRRYAFRPYEIQTGMIAESCEALSVVEEVVRLVNQVWKERETIAPSFTERKLPTVYNIFKLLPKTNCRECGYSTCLACAAEIRNGVISVEKCPTLSKPEYIKNREQIRTLFPAT